MSGLILNLVLLLLGFSWLLLWGSLINLQTACRLFEYLSYYLFGSSQRSQFKETIENRSWFHQILHSIYHCPNPLQGYQFLNYQDRILMLLIQLQDVWLIQFQNQTHQRNQMLFLFHFSGIMLKLVGYLKSFFGQADLGLIGLLCLLWVGLLMPFICNLYVFQIQIIIKRIWMAFLVILQYRQKQMNVIKQLIADTPQSELKDYESYLHTHLKLLMTGINKAKIQDTTQVQIRKNKCIEKCYKKNMQDIGDSSSIHDKIEQIRECKQKCGEQKKAVKKYLDDINYYSSLKFSNCSKSCIGDQHSQEYNSCIWNCLNKLDRRYKQYWMEQRAKIEEKFVPT